MSETPTPDSTFKPKKSVALSGVPAGNTALCTVGRTGNDLSYRGYDILEIAETCEFEEIAYLLVHGKLPNVAELSAYKARLATLRGVPEVVREMLERIPAAAHPMDVMRTGVSALGTVLPENVRITAIRPQVNALDQLSLDMTVEADAAPQVITFIAKLEGSSVFGSTEVSTITPPNQNDPYVHYRLTVNYAQKL